MGSLWVRTMVQDPTLLEAVKLHQLSAVYFPKSNLDEGEREDEDTDPGADMNILISLPDLALGVDVELVNRGRRRETSRDCPRCMVPNSTQTYKKGSKRDRRKWQHRLFKGFYN